MKKAVPIILIVLIVGIGIYTYITDNSKKVTIPDISLEEEKKDNVIDREFIEGNMENSGGASTVYVENIELINEFLDLDMMLRYRELMISYGIMLPRIVTDDLDIFYQDNEDLLNMVFGIFDVSEFVKFYKDSNINKLDKKDKVDFVTINSMTQEGNLIKVNATFTFGDKTITLTHYINYVFINGEPQLFIYN